MPKDKDSWGKYKKHYNPKWENEKGLKEWIRRVPGDDTRVLCTICNKTQRAHHADLIKHSKSVAHVTAVKGRGSGAAKFLAAKVTVQPVDLSQNVNQKSTDLKLATYVACHTSINAVDHLGETVSSCAESCQCGKNYLKTLQLHRTKCTNLIKNVIG